MQKIKKIYKKQLKYKTGQLQLNQKKKKKEKEMVNLSFFVLSSAKLRL